MRRTQLDMDALRSFVTGIEVGSFAHAADQLARSTSAVSAHLRKLEDQLGTTLVRRSGRGLALTEEGELLLPRARRLLELNDEAVAAIRQQPLEGWVRLGVQEDFGETVLPQVLGHFAREHPKVRIEARVARNVELRERVKSGQLDIALTWDDGSDSAEAEQIARLPMCWLAATGAPLAWQPGHNEPLPMVLLDSPCLLRNLACAALDRAQIPWRLAFVSPGLAGMWAAAGAGLGVAVRTPIGFPASVHPLQAGTHGLPALPVIGLQLHRSSREQNTVAAHLARLIVHALREALPSEWLSPAPGE